MRLHWNPVGEHAVISARRPAPQPDDGIDLEHNLEPACARIGPWFVLGTHSGVVRDLVARLSEQDLAVPTEGAQELVRLQGAGVAHYLALNAEALTMQTMLNDGKSREEAMGDAQGLRLAAESVDALELELNHAADGRVRLEARLELSSVSRDGDSGGSDR